MSTKPDPVSRLAPLAIELAKHLEPLAAPGTAFVVIQVESSHDANAYCPGVHAKSFFVVGPKGSKRTPLETVAMTEAVKRIAEAVGVESSKLDAPGYAALCARLQAEYAALAAGADDAPEPCASAAAASGKVVH